MPDEKLLQYRLRGPMSRSSTGTATFATTEPFSLTCSERDVEIEEYRYVLEECIRYRARVRPHLAPNRTGRRSCEKIGARAKGPFHFLGLRLSDSIPARK